MRYAAKLCFLSVSHEIGMHTLDQIFVCERDSFDQAYDFFLTYGKEQENVCLYPDDTTSENDPWKVLKEGKNLKKRYPEMHLVLFIGIKDMILLNPLTEDDCEVWYDVEEIKGNPTKAALLLKKGLQSREDLVRWNIM